MNSALKPKIIHENQHFLAIDKPSGLLVVQDRWDKGQGTLMQQVRQYLDKEAWPVHRLDKDASGIVLFAKDAHTRTVLEKCFQKKEIKKQYHVFVAGEILEPSGTINLSVSEDPKNPGRMKIGGKGAKAAITHYEVLEGFKGVSYLKVSTETGRQHQIRIHLKSLGCPVLCDPIYGSKREFYLSEMKRFYKKKEDEPEKPLMGRLALHAHRLNFTMDDGVTFDLESPLPKDFQVFLKYLKKFRGKGFSRCF